MRFLITVILLAVRVRIRWAKKGGLSMKDKGKTSLLAAIVSAIVAALSAALQYL